MVIYSVGGSMAAGAYSLWLCEAVQDPAEAQRRAEAASRIPRLRAAQESAAAEASERTLRVQRMIEATKTATASEKIDTALNALRGFVMNAPDRAPRPTARPAAAEDPWPAAPEGRF